MNTSDENFWSEFLEESDETSAPLQAGFHLGDPASKRVIQAVRELYRIDEDDRLSVQRSWERIVHMEQSSEPLAVPGTLARAENVPLVPKRAFRQRPRVLVACTLALLLIGSMMSILYLVAQKGSQQGALPTNTPLPGQRQGTPALLRLGTHLGKLALDMPVADVQALFKPSHPTDKGFAFGLNYQEYVDEGFMVFFDSSTKVKQIVTWSPSQGITLEGFALGMSLAQFTQIYHQGAVASLDIYKRTISPVFMKGALFAVSVADTYGTTLWAIFDGHQKAIQLTLLLSTMNRT